MSRRRTAAEAEPPAGPRRPWGWMLAGVVAAAGLGIYLRNRSAIDYHLRLLGAKRVADRFYAEYPRIAKNVAYGPGGLQRLDVYRPASGARLPVFLFVHGGSWNSGNKELYAPLAQRLLPDGIVVVIAGYRIFPVGKCRQQADDVAVALTWTLENIERYGGDPGRVVAGGHSAGAHLVALALLDRQWLAGRGHTSEEVCGYVGISGPYDIEAQMRFEEAHGRDAAVMTAVMDGREHFALASPVNHVRPDLPPILLIHGDRDETVPVSTARAFHARLQSAGARSELRVYARTTHTGILLDALAVNPARLVTDTSEFVRGCPPVATG